MGDCGKNSVECEFCDKKFYECHESNKIEEIKKYEHLASHPEFFRKIEDILKKNFKNIYNTIKPINSRIPIKKDRATHQLSAVAYNHDKMQYLYILKKLDSLLEQLGEYLTSKKAKIIRKKILADVFSSYSEAVIFEKLNKIIPSKVEMLDFSREPDVDFVITPENLSFEVKTPFEIRSDSKNKDLKRKALGSFVLQSNIKNKIKVRKDRYPKEIVVLCVDTRFRYPDFPMNSGNWIDRRILKDSDDICWDCCITFNSLNGKVDFQINPKSDISSNQKQILDKLVEELKNP